MSNEPGVILQRAFLGVRDELVRMRELAAGEVGADLAQLPAESGVINDTVRRIALAVRDLLTWLHAAVRDAAEYLIKIDAVLATIEVARDLVDAFGELLKKVDLQPLGDLLKKDRLFSQVSDDLGTAGEALQGLPKIPQLIPEPNSLLAIAGAIDALLGESVGANGVDPPAGAYGQLLPITPPASP